jgi:hypothetical protein
VTRVVSADATAAGLTFEVVRRPNEACPGQILTDHVAQLPTSIPVTGWSGYGVTDRLVSAVAWFDRSQRLWTGWLADDHGYQFTEAVYGVTAEDIADELTFLYHQRLDETRS